jgi:biopolymer transport protein ExbD
MGLMKARRTSSLPGSLPMAPMIDIVFQLITFFIFALNSEKIALSEEIQPPLLPKGQQESSPGPKDLLLEVSKDGILRFEGNLLPQSKSPNETRKTLESIFKTIQKEDQLVIRADQDSSFDLVKPALEAATKIGLNQVSLRVRSPAP